MGRWNEGAFAVWGSLPVLPVMIGLVTAAADLLASSLTPLIAPHLAAAALAMRLPRATFYRLIALLAVLMWVPAVAHSAHWESWVHRGIGLASLAIIASLPSGMGWIRRRGGDALTTVVLPRSATWNSNAPTHVHGDGLGGRLPDPYDLSFELSPVVTDPVAPVIARLQAAGQFDPTQIHLIESELRTLDQEGALMQRSASLAVGDRIGRFVIDRPLGRGGEGNVYRGHDRNTGELAAIKILHNVRVGERFRREMHLVRQLAHPNVVTAYEVGERYGLPYITMELLQGPDLYGLVREQGPQNWLASTKYILQSARGLAHAHRRDLVHRDIKPGNIICNGSGTVKIVDLGLATIGKQSHTDSVFHFETQEGHLAGTMAFMAPEQARSLANATVQSDIYGLGATWYFLLTGRVRLKGKTFSDQFENLILRRRFSPLPTEALPPPLRAIFSRMVAYDPADRYPHCDALAADLQTALLQIGEGTVGEGIEVLAVEDSRTDMRWTIEMLRSMNSTLTIHQARSLEEGIVAFHAHSIDLVLLDLSLPDSSGEETIRRFRLAAPAVPLVVVTGAEEEGLVSRALAAGADTFLSKIGLTAHRLERTIFVTLSKKGSISGAR